MAGIILFAENVVDTEQTARLTSEYQKLALENNLQPFLLAVDQEGDRVVRLGTGTSLPGSMALVATRDPKLAYEYGKIIAEELDSLGINVDLAPVLDINNNPNNPVAGERSISSNTELVGEIGSQLVKGLQENKVSAVVKHFSGHGDTAGDSHVGLPEVNKSKEEVMNMELRLFMNVADEGVDIIPDALNMQAIAKHFGQAEASLRSFNAWADILLMPVIMRSNEDVEKLEKVYAILENVVHEGEITEERLNDFVRRVLELKGKRGISDTTKYNQPVKEKVKKALSVVGSKEHLEKQRLITQRAITVGKNENMLPFRAKPEEKILMLAAFNNEVPGLNYGFDRLQREGVIPKDVKYTTMTYNENTTKEELKNQMKGYDYIVVISEIAKQAQHSPESWQSNIPQMFVDIANENNQKHVILSIAKHYDWTDIKMQNQYCLHMVQKEWIQQKKEHIQLKPLAQTFLLH
ncbi:glycoside hydrolase family 3 protein [Helcococcus ovis]|uniref:glycoside hydrolase family 3 protein n=1 Tax=Helcococcus ovis TaxID=72026 RepID=UPI0038BC3F59